MSMLTLAPLDQDTFPHLGMMQSETEGIFLLF